jgi:hypothetical protein
MLNPFPIYPLFVEWVWGGLEDLPQIEKLKDNIPKNCLIMEANQKLDFKELNSNIVGFSAKCKNFFLTFAVISSPIFKEIRLKVRFDTTNNLKIENLKGVIIFLKKIKEEIFREKTAFDSIKPLKLGIALVAIPTLKNKITLPKHPDWDWGLQCKYFYLRKENFMGIAANFGIDPVINSDTLSIESYRFIFDASLLRKYKNIYPTEFSFDYFLKVLEDLTSSLPEKIGG